MSQKNLKIIRKSKVLLTLNKQAYVRMCLLLDLNKPLKQQFHNDCIKNKYGNSSSLLSTDIDSLVYKIKAEDV